MAYKGDIIYIEQVLEGNTNAFSYIVDRHKDKAFNLAFRISGSREEAEEITQDSFLKAYRSLGSFKMQSSFATWFYRIVYNTSISYIRIKKKEVLSLEDFPADATDFIGTSYSEEEADKEYRSALLNFALQKIREDERGLITLFYYDELSPDEISEVTGISKSNLKVKLFRARQKMQEIIEKAEKKNLIYHG
ncbi:MAG: RNA polymerase sigma factor [Bacteroidales bacterium]|nr:RNA polymerase sigma factor [Bacteroidales bacterium]